MDPVDCNLLTTRRTVDGCTSINCAILDLGTRYTKWNIAIRSLSKAGICRRMGDDFRAGYNNERTNHVVLLRNPNATDCGACRDAELHM
jgi:hypothetical protein